MDLVNKAAGIFRASSVGLDLVRQDGAALLFFFLKFPKSKIGDKCKMI